MDIGLAAGAGSAQLEGDTGESHEGYGGDRKGLYWVGGNQLEPGVWSSRSLGSRGSREDTVVRAVQEAVARSVELTVLGQAEVFDTVAVSSDAGEVDGGAGLGIQAEARVAIQGNVGNRERYSTGG